MSTITKERVAGIASGEKCYTHDDVVELARIALASLKAEAVAFVMADDLKDSSIISTPAYRDLGEAMERTVGDVVALYVIHPAPLSLDAGGKLSNFISSQELLGKDFEKVLAENIEGLYVPGNSAPPAPVSVPDEATPENIEILASTFAPRGVTYQWDRDECNAAADSWNACRAAMLQGTDGALTNEGTIPASTPCKLRDAVDAIRNSGIAIDGEKILAERDVLNSPVIPDGWVACSERMPDPDSEFRICAYTPTPHEDVRFRFVPASLFKSVCRDATHWQYMPLPAAPQQEVK